MKRSLSISVPFFFAILSCFTNALADAWTKKPGEYYVKIAGEFLDTTREYDRDGEIVDILSYQPGVSNSSFTDVTFRIYTEYGLTRRVTLVGSLPFSILTAKRTELNDNASLLRNINAVRGGLSDLEVGVRTPLLAGKVKISFQSMLKVPLGYSKNPSRSGPILGSGSPDVDGRFSAGASLFPFPGWVELRAGYRIRGGGLANEYLFSAEFGATFKRAGGRVALSSLRPVDTAATGQSVTTRAANAEELKLSPALWVQLQPRVALSWEAFHTLSGRNTLAGTKWSVSLIVEN